MLFVHYITMLSAGPTREYTIWLDITYTRFRFCSTRSAIFWVFPMHSCNTWECRTWAWGSLDYNQVNKPQVCLLLLHRPRSPNYFPCIRQILLTFVQHIPFWTTFGLFGEYVQRALRLLCRKCNCSGKHFWRALGLPRRTLEFFWRTIYGAIDTGLYSRHILGVFYCSKSLGNVWNCQ